VDDHSSSDAKSKSAYSFESSDYGDGSSSSAAVAAATTGDVVDGDGGSDRHVSRKKRLSGAKIGEISGGESSGLDHHTSTSSEGSGSSESEEEEDDDDDEEETSDDDEDDDDDDDGPLKLPPGMIIGPDGLMMFAPEVNVEPGSQHPLFFQTISI
jgi:hypothetical protein